MRATAQTPPTAALQASSQFLAGGTTFVDYVKLGVWPVDTLVDIGDLREAYGSITVDEDGLSLGALVTMSEAADHPDILGDYPVIAQSLALAASPQIRNVATLGGNVLQRTRCGYFRRADEACNKHVPGSGCAAIGGNNRGHAVLGVSDQCISSYPGDFAHALVALDAVVDVTGPHGDRSIPIAELHTGSERPDRETVLEAGDLITRFRVLAGPHTRRSTYLKLRDRQSYQFGIVTVAVALDLAGNGVVEDVRIAVGGIGYKPSRSHHAEAVVRGQRLTPATADAAGALVCEGATLHGQNSFKPLLTRRAVARALLDLAGSDAAERRGMMPG